MRRALRIGLPLLLALALVGLAGYVTLGSERAARGLIRAFAAVSGGAFSVGEIRGSLRSGVRLQGLDVRFGNTRVRAAALDWQPGASSPRRREIALGRITIDSLHVALGASESTAEPITPPELGIPGRVTLAALEVRGLTLQPAAGPAQHIDSMHLAGLLDGNRLWVQRFALTGSDWSAQAQLRIDLDHEGTLDGVVQARAQQPSGAPLAMHGSLGGSLRHDIQAALDTTEPAPAHVLASIDTPLAGGPWQAHVWLEGTPLDAWRAGLPDWPLTLSGRARGLGSAATVDIDYRLRQTPAGTVTGRLGAQGESAVWQLTAQARAAPDSRIDASGEVDLTDRTLDASVDWQELRWPLGAAPAQVQSPSGGARLQGGFDDWTLALKAALTAQGQTGQITVEARGDDAQARIDTLDARLLSGRLRGTAELQWAPALRYAASVQAEGLDPGLVWPQWPGRLALELVGSGDASVTEVHLGRLGGTLRGQPLAGRGAVAWRDRSLRLSDVDLRLGRARLQATGTALGAGPPLEATLDVPAASELLAGARGRLRAEVEVTGPEVAQARLRIDGTELAHADLAIRTVTATLDLDRPRDRLALRLAADGVAIGAQRLAVDMSTDGTPGDHAVQLDLSHNDQRLTLAGRGGLLSDGWQGRITQGTLHGLPPADWTLAGPLALALRREAQSVEQHCWQADAAQACMRARSADGALDLAADLRRLPLTPLLALTGAEVSTDGTLDGHLAVRRASGPLLGELRLVTPPGALSVPAPDGSMKRLDHAGLTLSGDLDASSAQFAAQLAAPAGMPALLDATLRLPPLPAAADAPIGGVLAANLPDIGLFEPWTAQISGLAGRATAQLEIGGTVGAPRLLGEAGVQDLRAGVPALGITLREGQASVRADGGNTLRLSASARSGAGTLQLDGDASRSPDGARVGLRLHGERIQALDTTALQAQVDPDIAVEWVDGQLAVTGTIAVPQARIHAQDQPAAVRSSPDVVVLGRETSGRTPLAAEADLRVELGDDVRVDAYGFTGRLGGAVRLRQRGDGSSGVTGTVRVNEGQYVFYGQRLPVTQGELRYAGGPPDNPALRVTAQRSVGNVTAGVRLRGTARAPQTELFSTPVMPQADILSYLVLGRPLQQASGNEGELLIQAAAAAGLREGGALVKRLGSALGFEEATLGGDGNGGANLALGRYLAPRLYVGYGLALGEQGNALTLRYTLTEQWLVEVVSGLTQTADLLYQFER